MMRTERGKNWSAKAAGRRIAPPQMPEKELISPISPTLKVVFFLLPGPHWRNTSWSGSREPGTRSARSHRGPVGSFSTFQNKGGPVVELPGRFRHWGDVLR